MPRKLTTLLLICLMLAVPLRAAAGVAMIACATSHQTVGHVSEGHSEASSMQDMPGCHESGQVFSPALDHCQDDHGSSGKHAGSTCNACSSCCVGAFSLPAATQTALGLEPGSSLIAFLDRPYAGFHPDGLDRPPRHTLA